MSRNGSKKVHMSPLWKEISRGNLELSSKTRIMQLLSLTLKDKNMK